MERLLLHLKRSQGEKERRCIKCLTWLCSPDQLCRHLRALSLYQHIGILCHLFTHPHFLPALGHCDRIYEPWKCLLESCYRNPLSRGGGRSDQKDAGCILTAMRGAGEQRATAPHQAPSISRPTGALPGGGGGSHSAPVLCNCSTEERRGSSLI